MKVIINYGLSNYYNEQDPSANSGYYYLDVYSRDESGYYSDEDILSISSEDDGDQSGSITKIVHGNYLSAPAEFYGSTNPSYDYGVYIQVYPIFDEPTEDTSYEFVENVCTYRPISGAYTETIGWEKWDNYWYKYTERDGEFSQDYFYYENPEYEEDEYALISYLNNNEEALGTNITFKSYNPYHITYDGNSADGGTMTDSNTVIADESPYSTTELAAPNFYKAGYGFAGWSADRNATINSNSKIYGPNETIRGDELAYNNRQTTLYAVLVPPSGNLQNFSCNTLARGQVTALTDQRDNQTYAVARLADGNCWTIENLRLSNVDSNNQTIAFNSTNTNNPASSFALSASQNPKVTSWCYSGTACYNQSMHFAGNSMDSSTDETSIKGYVYSYGNYYNWYSATAGYGTTSKSSGNTSGDICPAGWHLPTGGGSSADYGKLDVATGGSDGTQSNTAESLKK